MQHRWNMYANHGERRIPTLIEQGEIGLPCINPSADSYQQKYDPSLLWVRLQNQSDLSERGLYLSLYCTERPIYEGKKWFIFTAHGAGSDDSEQTVSREVSWVEIKDLRFWNAGFREYARVYQARGVVDYSLYVSRTFGYCFLFGMRLDEDDEDAVEFTNFYSSIHHYHQAVAINELDIYQPFNDGFDWFSKDYTQEPGVEQGTPDITQIANRVAASMENWSDALSGSPLDNLVELGEDSVEGEED